MATLSPAALIKAKGGAASPKSASPAARLPTSPNASSARLAEKDGAPESQFPLDAAEVEQYQPRVGATTAAADDASEKRGGYGGDYAALGVEELISKLPDVLFPGDGDEDGEELTPLRAVYGSTPPAGPGGPGGYVSKYGSSPGRSALSASAPDFRFGSAPQAGSGGHGFGGRERLSSSPGSAASSPPARDGRRPRISFDGAASSPGGKYQPPNRRSPTSTTWDGDAGSPGSFGSSFGSFGSPPADAGARGARQLGLPPRALRQGGKARNNTHHPQFSPPRKKNPAPGFNGAGFRSAREVYAQKVHEFLCSRAAFGTPWVRVGGSRDSVAQCLEKPLTIPENYAQFFQNHAVEFELSEDHRWVAAKMPGEEHACIPPPPGHSGAASENTSAANSLASSPARSDDGFARVGSANKPCAYQFRPGGCRAGDQCRYSHEVRGGSRG